MWPKSVVLLVALAAAAAAAPGDVRIITEPSPGNEFVHIQTGRQLHPTLDGTKTAKREIGVEVDDEGKSGVIKHHANNEEIKIMVRKSESVETKVHEVHSDGSKEDNGKLKYHSSKASEVISLIDKKPAVPKKFEVLSTTKSKIQKVNEEDAFDFVDTDTALSPAGTSQSSRINIKKGPNGQDYEYEYVYYYYDEDEEPDNKAQPTPTTKAPERQRGPQFVPPREDPEEHQTLTRGRVSTEEPKRQREDPAHSRGEPDHGQEVDSKAPGRNRYTTIERGRGKPDVTTTVEPVINEVIPSRTPSRTRGRGNAPPAPVVEDIEETFSTNTRFPSRSRGSTTPAPATPSPQTEASPQRTRNNIRRPSLVDSSSFRTHSSDIPEVDQDRYLHQFAQKEIPTNTRDSDFEEYRTEPAQRAEPAYKPEPVVNERVTPSTPEPSTNAPSSAAPEDENKSDKAAFDLYAILQHQQEENNVLEPETTDVPETTTVITTTPTTTTTTTTTPAPTTTTTTQGPTQRGRFRGGTGSRNRFKAGTSSSQRGSSSTTTTTEASAEGEAPKRGRFQPQHSRNPSQVSAYGRRGSTRSTTTAAPQEETTRGKSSFSSNRYRSRGRVQPSTENPSEDTSQSVSTEATTARSRVRLNVNGGPRPLRPGPRINIGGRGRLGAQTPAPVEVQETPVEASPQPHIEEESANPEPTTTPAVPSSTQDALTRLRNRPRLKVHAGPSRARPPVPGLRRKEPATPEAPSEPAPTEPVPAEANSDEPTTTTPQPETTRHSLIGRRRPAIRRLPGRPPVPAPSS